MWTHQCVRVCVSVLECVFVSNPSPRGCVGVCAVRWVGEVDRPLAQALEGWVLQQAVTGLTLRGELDQAETLCSQVHTHLKHS